MTGPGDNNSDVNAISLPSREKNVIDNLQEQIMAWAERKGWNQGLDERSFGDWCTLITTEISEAYEDYRAGRGLNEIYYELDGDTTGRKYTRSEVDVITLKYASGEINEYHVFKPCGIPIEFADAVIRILHLAEFCDFNLYNCIEEKMRYNNMRAFRHGGKRT